MASHPPSNCCLKVSLHSGEPTGQITKLGGVETYVAGDKNSGKAILYLTDAFGIPLVNNKLVCDAFGRAGYYVVMPDLFNGDAVELPLKEGFDFMSWGASHGPDNVGPIVENVLKALNDDAKPKFVAATGHCFGAKYAVRLGADTSRVQAVGIAHPSFVSDDEIKALKAPVFISAAETDQAYPEDKRHFTETTLKENGVTYFTTLASGTEHGFAIKGDISKPHVKFAKEKCATDFIQWFDFHSAA